MRYDRSTVKREMTMREPKTEYSQYEMPLYASNPLGTRPSIPYNPA